MKQLTDFFPRVLPYAPGCSEPLALQALVDTAVEFCERTLVVQQKLEGLLTVEGRSHYDLDLPSNQAIAQIMRVWIDGRLLYPVPSLWFDELPPGTPASYHPEHPEGYLTLRLNPPADAENADQLLVVQAALRPTRVATEVADVLLEDWAEGIAAGALVRICSIPDAQFTNSTVASLKALQYQQAMHRARHESIIGRAVGTRSTQMRPLA